MKPYIIIASLIMWSTFYIIPNVRVPVTEITYTSMEEKVLIDDIHNSIGIKGAILLQTTFLIYTCFLLEFIVASVRDFRWKHAFERTFLVLAIIIFLSCIVRFGIELQYTKNYFFAKYEHLHRGGMLVNFIYDKTAMSFYVYFVYLIAISFLYYKAERARVREQMNKTN